MMVFQFHSKKLFSKSTQQDSTSTVYYFYGLFALSMHCLVYRQIIVCAWSDSYSVSPQRALDSRNVIFKWNKVVCAVKCTYNVLLLKNTWVKCSQFSVKRLMCDWTHLRGFVNKTIHTVVLEIENAKGHMNHRFT